MAKVVYVLSHAFGRVGFCRVGEKYLVRVELRPVAADTLDAQVQQLVDAILDKPDVFDAAAAQAVAGQQIQVLFFAAIDGVVQLQFLQAEVIVGFHQDTEQSDWATSPAEVEQSVRIIREIVAQPALLILDEATSHLDNENEALVQSALDEALRDRTALVIAHRLSTIRDADRIVVIDAGRIIEQGTHEELMNLDGAYARQVRAGETTSEIS